MLAPFLQVQETAATRQAFLKLLDRPRVEANERETGRKTSNGLVHIQWDFVSEQRAGKAPERVPALLVRPDKQGKFPVVIVLHGTGGNKEGMKSWLESFANKGVAAIAIDARYHGERKGARNKAEGYTEAITRTTRPSFASFIISRIKTLSIFIISRFKTFIIINNTLKISITLKIIRWNISFICLCVGCR